MTLYYLFLLLIIISTITQQQQPSKWCVDSQVVKGDESSSSSSSSSEEEEEAMLEYQFPGCRLFLAPSTIPIHNTTTYSNTNSSKTMTSNNLGIFTTRSLKRGQPITFPDIIIQVNDYYQQYDYDNNKNDNNQHYIGQLIHHYSWNSQTFGSHLEAKHVTSIIPGIGSISNAQLTPKTANTIPYPSPDVDEANVPRIGEYGFGAGAFTHYHNVSFYAMKDVPSGGEILVFYDKNRDSWVQNRTIVDYNVKDDDDDNNNNKKKNQDKNHVPKRDVNWLIQNGFCLDNIQVRKSKIKGAGRGAFATRFIPKGSIIAPVPLVVIPNRDSLLLSMKNNKDDDNGGKGKQHNGDKSRKKEMKQLLLNYCFGHRNSSVLFFPTSPIVNLINHAPTRLQYDNNGDNIEAAATTAEMSIKADGLQENIPNHNKNSNNKKKDNDKENKKQYTANARIQWSNSHFHKDLSKSLSLDELKTNEQYGSSLMMEYVATRDIQPNEEILFDYGPTWMKAWEQHTQSWEAVPNAHLYTPSYVMEDVAGLLRNEEEQLTHPYPSNVEISCFYQYSVYNKNRNDGIVSSKSKNTISSGEVTTVKWQMNRRTFEFKNLRPCRIMERNKLPNGQWSYKVLIKNRPGLPQEEMIPKGEMHVVNSVPRGAIRFTDKMYSTDQHLPNAFRHEIGIPDEIFPQNWMDL